MNNLSISRRLKRNLLCFAEETAEVASDDFLLWWILVLRVQEVYQDPCRLGPPMNQWERSKLRGVKYGTDKIPKSNLSDGSVQVLEHSVLTSAADQRPKD